MEGTSPSDAQNEGHQSPNESSSSSIAINQMAQPAAQRKSNLTKEVESLGMQSLEIPRGLDASGLHMTRQKTRRLQRISGKPSVFDAKESGPGFQNLVSLRKHPKEFKLLISVP